MVGMAERLPREGEQKPEPELEPATEAEPAPEAAGPATTALLPPPLTRATMPGLQSSVGNAGLARMLNAGAAPPGLLQRGPITSWFETLGHDIAEGVGLESSAEANLGRAEAFRDHGIFGPEDVIPGDVPVAGPRSSGGFTASYDPSAGQLTIDMKVAVNFKDGIDMSSGTPVPADARLTGLIANLPPPGPARTAYLARYTWDSSEKGTWMSNLETLIEGGWGGQYEFHVDKPGWEWLGATVNVDLNVHEVASSGRASDDHIQVDTVKFPEGENLYTAGGTSETGPGSHTDAFDQTMLIASTDLTPRPDGFLHRQIFFAHDSDVLDAASQTSIDRFVNRFQGAAPGTAASRPANVTLEAHCSPSGTEAYNMDLAQRRADAVRNRMIAKGFNNVATRVVDDIRGEAGTTGPDRPDQRRVDMIVDSGSEQILAMHEFGHAFGLGDEYAVDPVAGGVGGTGNPTGTAAQHDKQVKEMTDATGTHLPGAINENNDNVMSLGSAIQPQHYATFHHTLAQLTGVDEWALGPPLPYPGTATGTGTGTGTPAPTGTPTPTPTPGP
jgi:outer membrane protein OmpA-like peptidoglycan-associated protein